MAAPKVKKTMSKPRVKTGWTRTQYDVTPGSDFGLRDYGLTLQEEQMVAHSKGKFPSLGIKSKPFSAPTISRNSGKGPRSKATPKPSGSPKRPVTRAYTKKVTNPTTLTQKTVTGSKLVGQVRKGGTKPGSTRRRAS